MNGSLFWYQGFTCQSHIKDKGAAASTAEDVAVIWFFFAVSGALLILVSCKSRGNVALHRLSLKLHTSGDSLGLKYMPKARMLS